MGKSTLASINTPRKQQKMESLAIERIKKHMQEAKPYVLFSGGKDSLVSLDLVRRAADALGNEFTAIHADTSIGLPENVEYVRKACRSLKVKLVVVKPEHDFFELSKRKGFPTHSARWCCYELKIYPIRDYLQNQKGEKIIFDGIRAEESKQRANMEQNSWHKIFKCNVFHPIFHWKAKEMSTYLSRHQLFINPLYSKGFKRAAECWCGVFKSVKEFKLLLQNYPDFFEELVNLEASMRKGGSFLFKNGKKVYLRELKKENNIAISS